MVFHGTIENQLILMEISEEMRMMMMMMIMMDYQI